MQNLPAHVQASVASRSLAVAVSALDRAGSASLVVFECAEPEAGLVVASSLAPRLVSEEACVSDVRVCSPLKDRWSVGELDEMVVAPTRSMPNERHVVVVAAADRMDVPAAEHLLKAVEEPSSPTLFVFVVQDQSRVLPTILGRAGEVVHLDLPSHEERVASLTASGLPLSDAQEVVGLVGSSSAVTGLLAQPEGRSEALDAIRTAFEVPFGKGPSTTGAVRIDAALLLVVERMSPGSGSTERRALVRNLLRRVFDAWRASIRHDLRSASDARGYAVVIRRLNALDAAEAEISSYASPVNVLAALLARAA